MEGPGELLPWAPGGSPALLPRVAGSLPHLALGWTARRQALAPPLHPVPSFHWQGWVEVLSALEVCWAGCLASSFFTRAGLPGPGAGMVQLAVPSGMPTLPIPPVSACPFSVSLSSTVFNKESDILRLCISLKTPQ